MYIMMFLSLSVRVMPTKLQLSLGNMTTVTTTVTKRTLCRQKKEININKDTHKTMPQCSSRSLTQGRAGKTLDLVDLEKEI